MLLEPHARNPALLLLLLFAVWKTALLLLAVASPGDGYDASTTVLLARGAISVTSDASGMGARASEHEVGAASANIVVRKLLRWDAFYYTEVAARGYRFEQEWAFGWGFTRALSHISNGKPMKPPSSDP